MKKVIIGLFAVIGGLVVVAAIGFGVFFLISQLLKPSVADKTVLELDLGAGLIEDVPNDPIAQAINKQATTLRDIVEALERASNDTHVLGLLARVGPGNLTMAQAQEIRDAVAGFRRKGKFAVAYAETFDVGNGGSIAYYLAAAFDEIKMMPVGEIGLAGLMMETPFLRGTLDKLDIEPQLEGRYEYKNAVNTFVEKKFTKPHREAMEKIITSWHGQLVRGIAEGRKLSEQDARALIDRGPFLAKEALEARLVDALAYRDEVFAEVKKKVGDKANFLYLHKYLKQVGRPHDAGKKIALVFGVGGVAQGESGYDPLSGDVTMGSDTVAGALRAAIEDKDVKAILFRVDSPGGSAVASDAIWRETVRAKEAKKPVIISMGSIAGSGGYYVAMAAHKIVAQPGTITGSIGVLSGKMVTTGFWDKLGLSFDEVHAGQNAKMWSANEPFSEAEWTRFRASLDQVYQDFTGKVAAGRNLPKEKVLAVAKGRIWSGEDAKGLGLVDELGGYATALRLAKQAAGIGENERIRLQVFPAEKSLVETLLGEGPERSAETRLETTLAHALKAIQPLVRRAQMLEGGARRGELVTPEFERQR
jgi:protease-4